MKIPCSDSKITSAVWGPLGEFIIAGHESGELNQFSAKVSLIKKSISLGRQGLGEDIAAFLLWSWDRMWVFGLKPAASWIVKVCGSHKQG